VNGFRGNNVNRQALPKRVARLNFLRVSHVIQITVMVRSRSRRVTSYQLSFVARTNESYSRRSHREKENSKKKWSVTSLTGNEWSRSVSRPNLDAASTMIGESIFWTRWPASVFGYV